MLWRAAKDNPAWRMLFAKRPAFVVEDLGQSTQITIPAKRNLFVMVFLTIWVFGWLFGELFALSVLLAVLFIQFGLVFTFIPLPEIFKELNGFGVVVGLFMIVWLVSWTKGGYSALKTLVWQLRGKEIVEVSRQGINLSRPVFGMGKVQEYQAAEIVDVRLAKENINPNLQIGQTALNSIEFDYLFDTIGFGAGMEEKDAKELLEEVYKRYPQYKPEETESVTTE